MATHQAAQDSRRQLNGIHFRWRNRVVIPWCPRGANFEYLEEPGGMHANATKHDSRSLEGEGYISLVSGDEENHSPVFQNPGGVLQYRREGYIHMVDERLDPGTG